MLKLLKVMAGCQRSRSTWNLRNWDETTTQDAPTFALLSLSSSLLHTELWAKLQSDCLETMSYLCRKQNLVCASQEKIVIMQVGGESRGVRYIDEKLSKADKP